MKCFDCIVKTPHPLEADWILIDGCERVIPLCKDCLQEWIEMEGEINLDFYYMPNLDEGFIQKINETLKYLNDMNRKLTDRYFAVKKLVKDKGDHESILVKDISKAIEW